MDIKVGYGCNSEGLAGNQGSSPGIEPDLQGLDGSPVSRSLPLWIEGNLSRRFPRRSWYLPT